MNLTSFYLGDWQINPRLNSIQHAGKAKQLEPKAMDVLVYLCLQKGEIVTSDELLNQCWKDIDIGDNPLHKIITQLRKALALPLYQQFAHVRRNFLLIISACCLGIINATFVAFILSIIFNVPAQLSASVAALSVTTPISLIVTDSLGGINSLAAALVIFIGLLGALFGFMLFKLVKIYNVEAQGVAMGTNITTQTKNTQ